LGKTLPVHVECYISHQAGPTDPRIHRNNFLGLVPEASLKATAK
jgi:hypothetical protein